MQAQSLVIWLKKVSTFAKMKPLIGDKIFALRQFINKKIRKINQIILVFDTTEGEPVGLAVVAHVAVVTAEVQSPANGCAVL